MPHNMIGVVVLHSCQKAWQQVSEHAFVKSGKPGALAQTRHDCAGPRADRADHERRPHISIADEF